MFDRGMRHPEVIRNFWVVIDCWAQDKDGGEEGPKARLVAPWATSGEVDNDDTFAARQ